MNAPRETVCRLLGHNRRGGGYSDTFWSATVPCVERIMKNPRGPKHRLPSRFMVLFNGRWHRVYLDTSTSTIHGRPAFIGHRRELGERIDVDYLPA